MWGRDLRLEMWCGLVAIIRALLLIVNLVGPGLGQCYGQCDGAMVLRPARRWWEYGISAPAGGGGRKATKKGRLRCSQQNRRPFANHCRVFGDSAAHGVETRPGNPKVPTYTITSDCRRHLNSHCACYCGLSLYADHRRCHHDHHRSRRPALLLVWPH